jgi:predicted aconitase with swiveling domain
MGAITIHGIGVGKGKASGEAIVTKEPITFNNGVDPTKGTVIEKGHELEGQSITDKILVFPVGKGSSGGSYVLYDLADRGLAPSAIIMTRGDTIIVTGCVMGKIPLVHKCDKDPVGIISTGDNIEIDVESGLVTVNKQ